MLHEQGRSEWELGLYFRDRWQVNRSLTLNLGLRWERYPLMTRADRGIEYYDDTTMTVTQTDPDAPERQIRLGLRLSF